MFVFPLNKVRANNQARNTQASQEARNTQASQDRRVSPLSSDGFLFVNELPLIHPELLILLYKWSKKDLVCYTAYRTHYSAALLDSASPASMLRILTRNFSVLQAWFGRNRRKLAFMWRFTFPENMRLRTRNIANFVSVIKRNIHALKGKPLVQVTNENLEKNALIMTYGNITYGGYSCNGGCRMILSHMNYKESECGYFDDNITNWYSDSKPSAKPYNVKRTYGSPPIGMGSIQYTNINCVNSQTFQFAVDLGNTCAGNVTCLYLVPMLYRTDYPIKTEGTAPLFLDRTYLQPEVFGDSTSKANIYNNYTNSGQPITFYSSKEKDLERPAQRCLLNRMQQYDASWYYKNSTQDPNYGCTYDYNSTVDPISGGGADPVELLAPEWGIGYCDAQGVGMGSGIEIDIVECTPCGLSVTLHGLNDPAECDENGNFTNNVSKKWSEYDTDGYFVNIHNCKGAGMTSWGSTSTSCKIEYIGSDYDPTVTIFVPSETIKYEPESSHYCPFAYGPFDVDKALLTAAMLSRLCVDFNESDGNEYFVGDEVNTRLKDEECSYYCWSSFFINSLLPFDVKSILTPMENGGYEIVTTIEQISPVSNDKNKVKITITCPGGFPTTSEPKSTVDLSDPANTIPVQDLTQNLHKMSPVVALWSTSQNYEITTLGENTTPLTYDSESAYDYRKNTSWWLDGYCPIADARANLCDRGWCLPDEGFLERNDPSFVDNPRQILFRDYDHYTNMHKKYKYYYNSVAAQSYIATQNVNEAKLMDPVACMITDLIIYPTTVPSTNKNYQKCWSMDLMYRGLNCIERATGNYNNPLVNWSGGYNSMYGVCTGTVESTYVLRNADILTAANWSNYQLLTLDNNSAIRLSGGTAEDGNNGPYNRGNAYKNLYNLAGEFNITSVTDPVQIQSAEVSFMGQKNIGLQWFNFTQVTYNTYGAEVRANMDGCIFNIEQDNPSVVIQDDVSTTYSEGNGNLDNGSGTFVNYELDYMQFDTISCLGLNVLTHYNLDISF
jgi:hypothetical protein